MSFGTLAGGVKESGPEFYASKNKCIISKFKTTFCFSLNFKLLEMTFYFCFGYNLNLKARRLVVQHYDVLENRTTA